MEFLSFLGALPLREITHLQPLDNIYRAALCWELRRIWSSRKWIRVWNFRDYLNAVSQWGTGYKSRARKTLNTARGNSLVGIGGGKWNRGLWEMQDKSKEFEWLDGDLLEYIIIVSNFLPFTHIYVHQFLLALPFPLTLTLSPPFSLSSPLPSTNVLSLPNAFPLFHFRGTVHWPSIT